MATPTSSPLQQPTPTPASHQRPLQKKTPAPPQPPAAPPHSRCSAASGEHIDGALRPEDVVDPSVERFCIRARFDASPFVVRERDSCTHKETEERFAPGLDLPLDLPFDPSGSGDRVDLLNLVPYPFIRLELLFRELRLI